MKNLGKIFALMGLFLLVNFTKTTAQISFSLGLRFAPAWAPVEYAHHTRYYYLPDLDCYYDASLGGYYFHDQDGDDWFFTRTLPSYIQGFDFYNCPKVALEYYGDRPFEYFQERRYGYFNHYHPDGLIPYYNHEYWERYHEDHDRFRGGDRDFHERREFYNQGYDRDRRDGDRREHENQFNRQDQNYGNFRQDRENLNNRPAQNYGNDHQDRQNGWGQNRDNYQNAPRQDNNQSNIRPWVNGERNISRNYIEQKAPAVAGNDHFHNGGEHFGGRRSFFN